MNCGQTNTLQKNKHFDSIFQHTFRNAVYLGHQEDRIQIELSNIGLNQWSHLSVENRKIFIPFLRNSARKHASELIQLKHNKISRLILCNGVKNNTVITKHCNN